MPLSLALSCGSFLPSCGLSQHQDGKLMISDILSHLSEEEPWQEEDCGMRTLVFSCQYPTGPPQGVW